jgi:hypothetical protein
MPALHPNNLFLVEINAFMLLVLVAGGLATCLLGYPLFRVLLAAFGLMAGIAGGMDVAHLARGADPATLDFAVACVVLGGVGLLLAWFACRVAFSMAAGWLVATQVQALTGVITGSPDGAMVWVIGLLLGLAVGVLAYGYMRTAVIATSSIVGAVIAVYAITLLLFGVRSGEALLNSTFGQGRSWVAWLLVLIAVGLSAVGMWLQTQLADAVGDRFMPKTPRRKRRGRGGRRGRTAEVRPRFTRV